MQPPGTPHAAIMKALSARWSTVKRQAQAQQQQTRDSPAKMGLSEEKKTSEEKREGRGDDRPNGPHGQGIQESGVIHLTFDD